MGCYCWVFETEIALICAPKAKAPLLLLCYSCHTLVPLLVNASGKPHALIYYLNARNPFHWSFLLCRGFSHLTLSLSRSLSSGVASLLALEPLNAGEQQQFVLCPCAKRKDSRGHASSLACWLARWPLSLSLATQSFPSLFGFGWLSCLISCCAKKGHFFFDKHSW